MYKAGSQAWWWFVLLLFPVIQLIALVVLFIAWVKIFQKSDWKFAIIPLISFPLLIGSIFFWIMSFMTSSAPFKMAVEQIKQNPVIIQSLGEPISAGWFVRGNLTTSDNSGSACLAIAISGSKTKGEIYVDAEQRSGKWDFRQLALAIEGRNEPVALIAPPLGYQGSLCF